MSTRAYAEQDWIRDTIKIAVRRDLGGGFHEVLLWGDVAVRRSSEADQRNAQPTEDAWLHVREDDARAIYEALAEHFGHNGHDTRSLRKDYDAERSRVDKLIGHLIGGTR